MYYVGSTHLTKLKISSPLLCKTSPWRGWQYCGKWQVTAELPPCCRHPMTLLPHLPAIDLVATCDQASQWAAHRGATQVDQDNF